jgi:hypothetical protein
MEKGAQAAETRNPARREYGFYLSHNKALGLLERLRRPIAFLTTFASTAIPALCALLLVRASGVQQSDTRIVETTGLGLTKPYYLFDALFAELFRLSGIGNLGLRSALMAALTCGLLGLACHQLASRILGALFTIEVQRPFFFGMTQVLALWVALAATMNQVCLEEASRAGGSLVPVVLGLAPLIVASCRRDGDRDAKRAFALGLLLATDYRLFLLASPALLIPAAPSPRRLRSFLGALLLPIALILFPSPTGVPLSWPRVGEMLSAHDFSAEVFAGQDSLHAAGTWTKLDVGKPVQILSLIALIFLTVSYKQSKSFVAAKTRVRALGAIAAAAVLGFLAMRFGSPHSRLFSPMSSLVLRALLLVLAAVGLMATYVWSQSRRAIELGVPRFAPYGALALAAVLLMTLPLSSFEEVRFAAVDPTIVPLSADWQARSLAPLPRGAAVLMQDEKMLGKVRAIEALGELRQDLEIVSLPELTAPASARATLRAHPKLAPLLRDLVMAREPSEAALSEIVATTPIVLDYSPSWSPVLARHLLPRGIFTEFAGEPRGLSERKVALIATSDLAKRMAKRNRYDGYDGLRSLTRERLRRVALAMSSTGEKESAALAMENLRLIDPNDATVTELAKRIVVARPGPIDVGDLADGAIGHDKFARPSRKR